MAPEPWPRRVLLAVSGLSPQIVTETLFALAVAREPSFVPTEAHLVTTAEGAERARLTLLGPEGALAALAAEWDLPELAGVLDEGRIQVVTDAAGTPLEDLLTPEDNARAADLITARIRGITADPEAALHVSLAGGRKTMGFFAGYALSLFGRPQDELSHVLVPAELEQHPQFFFPPRRPRVLFGRDNRPIRAEAAAVRLAAIPLVPLRHGLPRELLDGTTGYAHAVRMAAARLGPPRLVVDLPRREVTAGGVPLAMPPVQLAFCAWLALRRQNPNDAEAGVSRYDADPTELLALYRETAGPAPGALAKVMAQGGGSVPADWLEQRKARHNKLVEVALGWSAAPYRVVAEGRRPRTVYRLALDAEAVEVRR